MVTFGEVLGEVYQPNPFIKSKSKQNTLHRFLNALFCLQNRKHAD